MMNSRTREYLKGRFGDHYRVISVSAPPRADEREWGIVPWTGGPDERFSRHKSLLEVGNIQEFITRESPKHVYFSSSFYKQPSANKMEDKKWKGADLVFDLDADHLPDVDPDEDDYQEMLEQCKKELIQLLDKLTNDFEFNDLTIVFSGSRGYHVHVRDDHVKKLEGPERAEIVNYVKGEQYNVNLLLNYFGNKQDELRPTEPISVVDRLQPYSGGWNRHLYKYVNDFVDEVVSLSDENAYETLEEVNGIGGKTSGREVANKESNGSETKGLLKVLRNRRSEVRRGAFETSPQLKKLVRGLADEMIEQKRAVVDEPVTTDVNRLIRFPGSLHGGTGFKVCRLSPGEVKRFDPFSDAIAETFIGHDISIDVQTDGEWELNNRKFSYEKGVQTVPEYLGIYLMARGLAEKVPESETSN